MLALCDYMLALLFFFFFFFKQKTAYEIHSRLEFRRVLFRSRVLEHAPLTLYVAATVTVAVTYRVKGACSKTRPAKCAMFCTRIQTEGGQILGSGECLSQAIARSCWLPSPTPPSDVSQSPLGESARALHQGPRRQEQRWVLLH